MAVSTAASFLDLLAASKLLSPDEVETLRAEAGDDDPKAFATRLVKRGVLTRWQAQQLLGGNAKFILGKYKLLETIGQGGMGTVLKAEQIGIGRVVALKLMSKAILKNPNAVNRFLREIRSAAALNHPNIVAAYDADSAGQKYFLVMEYVHGRDLKEWIKKHKQLPVDWACECIRQAAEGLQHAHEHGMIHRDIKPANLLVVTEKDGTKPLIKILDMGLARFTSETASLDEGLTQTGQVMGTPDYIAPEQARSTKDADIRSDIFSLGCTLFEMLAGTVPFGGQNVMEKLMARAVQDAPRVRSLRPEVPAELDRIVARMLARDVQQRYQTPGEVAAALAPFAAGGTDAASMAPIAVQPESAAATWQAAPDATLNEFLDQLGDTAGPMVPSSASARRAGRGMAAGWKKPPPWLLIGGGASAAIVVIGWLFSGAASRGNRDVAPRKPGPTRVEHANQNRKPTTATGIGSDAQREAAKWVIGEGGSVTILLSDQQLIDAGLEDVFLDASGNREKLVEKSDDFPFGPLRIVAVSLHGRNHVGAIGMRRLADLPTVQRLNLAETQLNDDALEYLAGMKDLVYLDLMRTQVTGAGMAHLRGMSKLEALFLRETGIDDAGLEHFGQLTSLRQLGLEFTPISGEGLVQLGRLSKLRDLSLEGARVTDEGLAAIAGLKQLTSLSLAGTPISDSGLEHLAKCTELRMLALFGTKITGSGLIHLRGMTQLNHIHLANCPINEDELKHLDVLNPNQVDLSGTGVTDAALKHLEHMSHLSNLVLIQTNVTDSGMARIARLGNLQSLHLGGTKVTAGGVARLREALPNCQIFQ